MELKSLGIPPTLSAASPLIGPNRPVPVTEKAVPTPASASPLDRLTPSGLVPGQAAESLHFVDSTPATDPPTREELEWSLALEAKILQGYSPTAAESVRYNEIVMRLEASAESDSVGLPSPAEMEWALGLEDKIKQGYRPTPEEVKQYQHLAIQIFLADQPTSIPEMQSVSPDELAWAKALEEKITQTGYQAIPEEIRAYEDIYRRFQTEKSQTQAPAAPTPEELKWAQELAEKMSAGGYQPKPEEISRYTDIYNRHQAVSTPKHARTPGVQAQEVQWYLDLEAKIKQGYQPTDSELDRAGQIREKMYLQDSSLIQPEQAPISQHERDWALRLRSRAESGTPPTEAELHRYEQIFKRHAGAQ